MTASLHALGPGRDAGLYYVNDPNREARPRNRDEYYVSDGGGVWWSSSGSIIADGATIDKETFRDLCAGIDPRTGQNLVRGAGAGHRAGWDLTLSAPKSLSLLWASGTPDQRAEIEAMQKAAVEATLDFVRRQELLEVRLGAGGVVRETPTDLIVGRFDHHTSREGDPNIHTHCVVINVASSLDGKHRTLEPEAMYRWEMTIGAAYRAELSHLLAERGFALRPAGRDQIEIAGVDETIIETFSKRSRQIEEAVGDRDRTSGRAKELAALASRGVKSEVPTGAVLEARWREEFEGREATFWRDLLEAGHAARSSPERDRNPDDGRDAGASFWDGPPLDPVPVEGAGPVAIAASQLLRHDSVVDRRQVLRRSLVEASRCGIGLAAVEGELQDLQDARALLTLRAGRNAAWTTEHLAKAEAAMLRACERADERNWFDADAIAQVLEAAKHLSEEQREAVEALTSRDGVSLIEAGAGTGKTTLASAVRDAAAGSSLRVIGLAPTWIAADELTKSIGVPAQAVAKWRYDREIGGQQADAATWDANTVILLDEAGMLGTLDVSAVMVAAKEAGAKVIVFGDRRQLEAVAQGSALSAVAGQLQRVETLKVVRRQESEWQRTASLQMGEGRFGEALASYHQHDAIRFAEGSKATIDATIRAWVELRERHGDDVLIVTRSNKDANALNQAARRALRGAGHLGEEEVALPSVNRNNKAVELRLAAGDRIRFGASLKAFGIRNGTRAVVGSVEPQPDGRDAIVRVRLEDGRSIASPWSALVPPLRGKAALQPPRIVHAYAGTSHSVQGRTADAAVFHVGQRTDARETYVAMTRHRKDVRIVVDADRLMNSTSSEIVPGDVGVDTKLAALVAEAERYDEKENVYTLQHMQPSASTPTRVPGRSPGGGLTW